MRSIADNIMPLKPLFASLIIMSVAVLAGIQSAEGDIAFLVAAVGMLVCAVLILRDPTWGVIILVGIVSFEQTLTIYAPSFFRPVLILGALTVISFLMTRRNRTLHEFTEKGLLILACLFTIWVVLRSSGNLGLAFTYVQLLVLMFLASELVTLSNINLLMKVFVFGTVIGSIYFSSLFEAGGLRIDGNTILNRNSMAFYFTVALMISLFLFQRSKLGFANLMYLGAALFLVRGILVSESRSGFIGLLIVVVAFIGVWPLMLKLGVQLNTEVRRALGRPKHVSIQREIRSLLLVVSAAVVLQFFVTDEFILAMQNRLFAPAQEGIAQIDTARTELIQQGLQVWLSSPLIGVGIRQFGSVQTAELRENLTAHNLYVVLLAETGIFGFLFFMGWIGLTIRYFFMVYQHGQAEDIPIAVLWLTVMFLVLFRGIFASTLHYDKLLWVIGGISIGMRRSALGRGPLCQNG